MCISIRFSVFVFVILAISLFSLPGFAQYNGNIQGVVTDSSGAAISGATVRLRNADTNVSATDKTSESGNYRFSSLPPGNYVVSAEADRFQKAEAKFTLSTA